MTNVEDLPFCACGCGERVSKNGNKFIRGHNAKLKPLNAEDNPNWKGGKVETFCFNCGCTLFRHPSHLNESGRHYCSQKCRGEYFTKFNIQSGINNGRWKDKIEITCDNCGRELLRREYEIFSTNFCSHKCKNEYQTGLLVVRMCINCKELFMGGRNALYCPDCKLYEYCYMFDEICRDNNRRKYNYKCFICDVSEKTTGRKLDVHHIDYNKNQGCDEKPEWKLLPLCRSCHAKTNGSKEHQLMWEARLIYLRDDYWS